MPVVKLDGTYYYGPRGAKRRYGPGDAVDVPEGLAVALGLVTIGEVQPDDVPAAAETEPDAITEPTQRRARKAKGDARSE
jgi:hypothetical protein